MLALRDVLQRREDIETRAGPIEQPVINGRGDRRRRDLVGLLDLPQVDARVEVLGQFKHDAQVQGFAPLRLQGGVGAIDLEGGDVAGTGGIQRHAQLHARRRVGDVGRTFFLGAIKLLQHRSTEALGVGGAQCQFRHQGPLGADLRAGGVGAGVTVIAQGGLGFDGLGHGDRQLAKHGLVAAPGVNGGLGDTASNLTCLRQRIRCVNQGFMVGTEASCKAQHAGRHRRYITAELRIETAQRGSADAHRIDLQAFHEGRVVGVDGRIQCAARGCGRPQVGVVIVVIGIGDLALAAVGADLPVVGADHAFRANSGVDEVGLAVRHARPALHEATGDIDIPRVARNRVGRLVRIGDRHNEVVRHRVRIEVILRCRIGHFREGLGGVRELHRADGQAAQTIRAVIGRQQTLVEVVAAAVVGSQAASRTRRVGDTDETTRVRVDHVAGGCERTARVRAAHGTIVDRL